MQAIRKLLPVSREAVWTILGVHPAAPLVAVARVTSTPVLGSMDRANAISYEDMKKLIAEGQAWIFDVRSPEEVASGRIANSVNIPVAEVEEAFRMDPETFKMKFGVDKPGLDEKNLVFHCQMGRRGARATEIALALGYAKARNYTGGYKEWSEKEGK